MHTLTGQFQITDWQETTQSEHDGLKRSLANVKLDYSGDLTGTSELQYLLSYQSDGSADFVGFESLQVTINGDSGSLILRHIGRFVAGVAKSQFEVLQSTIKDKLIGSTGSFTSGENGQAQYSIEVS
ncbi:DUF3224 domain-containing protein [uncultured Paraglaciecola sp.]|uniref:DUF3224 domain-containing protein n=1 Tax=uncultured Paraglaciecola sp. TaxID=1765024 RepID=UPI0030DAB95E|tara:strand:+ start:123148 stop:123528 length:381 start_codon:yes stop_codon:yes gene_type:complete